MSSENDPLSGRRPIKTRDTNFARYCAVKLGGMGVSPNVVSVASSVFALKGAILIHFGGEDFSAWYLWVGAAMCIQLRLLCNLLDGMIAVEGGKGTYNGDLFNEIPDRFSDVVLLVAAGYACVDQPLGAAVGWVAALAAILTAYIRTYGAALTGNHDFCGPMAKAHRMFFLTVVLLAIPFSGKLGPELLFFVLVLIGLGGMLTFWRRLMRLSNRMKSDAR